MATIGVFDSGVGGLTVLRELMAHLPGADYLYFGDTARLPYGSNSVETVSRYATPASQFLEHCGAQLLVIACNTATALALDALATNKRAISSTFRVSGCFHFGGFAVAIRSQS